MALWARIERFSLLICCSLHNTCTESMSTIKLYICTCTHVPVHIRVVTIIHVHEHISCSHMLDSLTIITGMNYYWNNDIIMIAT